MTKHGVFLGFAAVVCLLATGCGGDDAKPSNKGNAAGTNQGGSGGKATTEGGSDGEGGEAASAPQAGSGGSSAGTGPAAGTAGMGGEPGSPVITFESLPAGIELEVDAASKEAGLTLKSSSLIQDTSTALFYTEWRAALYNGTTETQCFIEMTADFQNAAGTSVIEFHTFAYGAGYDTGSGLTLTASCAAPGETVPIWSNDNPMMALPLGSIAKLVVTLTPMARPEAVIHPSTPTLGPLTKEFTALEWWQISGMATSTADIYNVKLTFWGKVGEFFVDDCNAFHSEDFLQGQSWAYETITGIDSVELDEVVSHFSFIDGTSTAARIRLNERDSALWDAADERRRQHLALR